MNRLLCVAALSIIGLVAGPARAGVGTSEEAKLVVPGDGSPGVQLGTSTALDGNTLIVGRPEQSVGAGSAQVFVRSGTTWTLQATLVATHELFVMGPPVDPPGPAAAFVAPADFNGASRVDAFGTSVALSGNTAVIGAPGDEAAYVFVRNGTTWTQERKLFPSGVTGNQDFGAAVAVSGDVCFVGAPRDSSLGPGTQGSTYVFIRDDGAWTAKPKLWAADGAADDRFGSAVAMHNGSAIVGAPFADGKRGVAYIFVSSGGTWLQTHKLTPPVGATGDLFGSSVGMFANSLQATAAIGAPGHYTELVGTAGAAYVFERKPIINAVVWDPAGMLTANPQSDAQFGARISISGRFDAITGQVLDRIIAVGASRQSVDGDTHTGAAYVFVPSTPGTWTQQGTLFATDRSTGDQFGAAIAASGATVAVGAPTDDIDSLVDEGSAYVFTRSGTTWSQQAHLSVFSAATGDQGGFSVAISGDTALVGAPFDTVDGDFRRGSATVFVRGQGGWTQQARLLATDGVEADVFGSAVALSGNTAVIGAPSRTGSLGGPGKAYVFVREGSSWTQQARLNPFNAIDDLEFGASVAVSGETILVGTPYGDGKGAAYAFVRNGTQWSLQERLADEDGAFGDGLGKSLALSGNTAAVGAPYDNLGIGADQGSVSVFVRSDGTWTQQDKVFASDAQDHDLFGATVALSGRRMLVGAPRGAEVGAMPGSAYVFERTPTDWEPLRKLTVGTPGNWDGFGTSVALAGDIALVGAPLDALGAVRETGSAYLFTLGRADSVSTELLAPDDAPNARFGHSVALSERVALVGAPLNHHASQTWAGAVYASRLATDYGDARDPGFPTLFKDNGARHLLELDGPRLGAIVDAELDGQPNSGATGDDIGGSDDEDGVVFGSLTGGIGGNVFVTVSDASVDGASLDGWIDFNRDGDWQDAGERVFRHRAVVNGSHAIGFAVPAGIPAGSTLARIRLSSNGVAAPTGLALDGEVEDVQVTLQSGAPPTLWIDDVRLAEGNAGTKAFKFTVTLSAKSVSPVTVMATTADGTATAPGDYKTRSLALSIDPGQTQVRFSIPVVGDTQAEPRETLVVKLTQPSGATLADARGVGTIVNDD